jgi:hypothetical protein
MGKIVETLRKLFPLLQPEWIMCRSKDIPTEIMIAFIEEEEYERRIGKISMDIKIKGYRYILTPKKEIFMYRRKVSLV